MAKAPILCLVTADNLSLLRPLTPGLFAIEHSSVRVLPLFYYLMTLLPLAYSFPTAGVLISP